MSKITSRARQLRLSYSLKQGRDVPLQEIADATGIHRNVLRKIEANQTSRIDFDTLKRLCDFYGVGVGEILEYDPNGRLAPNLSPAVPVTG
jgi:putative transcriptional regulator